MVTTVPGTFHFLAPFAAHFRRAGWTVDALSGSVDGFRERDCFDDAFAVEWSRNPLDPRNLGRAPARVREVVARGAYDVVHVHTPVAAFVTRFALRRRTGRAPRVVYTAHGFRFHPGGRPWSNATFLSLELLAARWTDYLVVMNAEDAAAARRWRLVPEERLRVMPGIGVDLAHYAADAVAPAAVRAVRGALGIGDDPCFLVAGELIARKRQEDLLRAFARLGTAPGAPRAHVLLAGAGPLEDRCRALARQLGVADRVHFLGFRGDVATLMRACTALVLPSESEGLPRCVLEAMCLGAPVIGTDIRGTRELLADGCGFLYPVGDLAALAAALRDVLVDPAGARSRAERARARVARYDLQHVIRLHEALYGDALGDRSPARLVPAPA
jgi:glycosyltransferase involved in cell wall biosynthesis